MLLQVEQNKNLKFECTVRNHFQNCVLWNNTTTKNPGEKGLCGQSLGKCYIYFSFADLQWACSYSGSDKSCSKDFV